VYSSGIEGMPTERMSTGYVNGAGGDAVTTRQPTYQPVETEGADRVRSHTDPDQLSDLDREARGRLERLRSANRQELDARVAELERESDVERALEINASILALSGLALGVTVNRKLLLLSGIVLGFLLQHGIQGWCPPLPILRRFGLRTRHEIDAEKYAVKAMRGDFENLRRSSPS
jgi:hypothetical protein